MEGDKMLKNKLIFKKYKVLEILGEGSFGFVYKGKNMLNKELVALKFEEWKKKGDLLENEAFFLYNLKGFGIPEVKSFGICGKYKILVQTLLGKSLEDIFEALDHRFTLKDICMIGIQLIDRFEYIHSKYIIHRDMKPDNIVFDYQTNKIIYLIDFGLAKKYRSSRTGKHIQFSITNRLTGTVRYTSVNSNRGKEQSRRDDLESLGYVLIYFANQGYLPWQGLNITNKIKRYKQIYLIKKNIKPEKLCKGLPEEFCIFIKYVKNLKFEENPDYNYLRSLFINIMNKRNYKNDLNFSWLGNRNIIKKLELNYKNENNKLIDLKKRTSGPHIRLYRSIKNSKEKNRNKNINNIDKEEKIINNLKIHKNLSTDYLKLENNEKKNQNPRKIRDNYDGTQKTQIELTIDIDDEILEQEINKNSENNSKRKRDKFEEIGKINKEKNIKKDFKRNNRQKNEINQNNIPINFNPIDGTFNDFSLKGIFQDSKENSKKKFLETNPNSGRKIFLEENKRIKINDNDFNSLKKKTNNNCLNNIRDNSPRNISSKDKNINKNINRINLKNITKKNNNNNIINLKNNLNEKKSNNFISPQKIKFLKINNSSPKKNNIVNYTDKKHYNTKNPNLIININENILNCRRNNSYERENHYHSPLNSTINNKNYNIAKRNIIIPKLLHASPKKILIPSNKKYQNYRIPIKKQINNINFFNKFHEKKISKENNFKEEKYYAKFNNTYVPKEKHNNEFKFKDKIKKNIPNYNENNKIEDLDLNIEKYPFNNTLYNKHKNSNIIKRNNILLPVSNSFL